MREGCEYHSRSHGDVPDAQKRSGNHAVVCAEAAGNRNYGGDAACNHEEEGVGHVKAREGRDVLQRPDYAGAHYPIREPDYRRVHEKHPGLFHVHEAGKPAADALDEKHEPGSLEDAVKALQDS